MLSSSPLWLTALLFVLASGAIWWAGTRLEHRADEIARRTGLGHSFTGLVLLATVTSLPEVATTLTAVLVLDNPSLAVHNLLGGVALQTAILAIADLAKPRKGALTFFTPDYSLLVQGVGLVVLLQLAVGGVVTRGAPAIGPMSLWPVLILGAYGWILYMAYRHRGQPRWTPSALDDVPEELRPRRATSRAAVPRQDVSDPARTRWLYAAFGALALIVLGAGYLATELAEQLAHALGLSDAFVGATLLALATSLPEVSTTFEAARRERYSVAFSNIFGSNCFDVALLLLAEVAYVKGGVFARVDSSVAIVPLAASIMTCVYLWGLMERRNGSILGIGKDSAAALLVYAAGVALLYFVT